MTSTKRLLLIGGYTDHLLKAARASGGAEIVWCQFPEEIRPEHADLASEIFPVDFTDWEQLRPVVEKAYEQGAFDAVVSLTEPGLDPAARVNDLLGLGGTGYEVSHRFTDKWLMRRRLAEAAAPGAAVVGAELVTDRDGMAEFGARYGYPFIVKPTSGTASFGVVKVNGPEEVEGAWQEVCRLRDSGHPLIGAYDIDRFIMEEFVEGPLCSAEAFSFDGHHVVMAITEAITEESNHVHVGHVMPARLTPELEAAVVRATCEFLDALGYRDGASHTEFKLSPRGPVIIESQNRVGGALLTDMVESVYGTSPQELAFSWALGLVPPMTERPAGRGGAASWLIVAEPGRVREVRGLDEVRGAASTLGVDLWVGPGDVIRSFDGQWDGLGHVASRADTADDAIRVCQESLSALRIVTEG
ncbi:ATP-grasp domain-containing protein [Streptomyces sp. NPDC051909]|uniref:ATP-grasp domain-containing protein n=1 Tax=Streptomyces sp. NPDC051909 TaxID=3154944 RepID=UPI00344A52F1